MSIPWYAYPLSVLIAVCTLWLMAYVVGLNYRRITKGDKHGE